MFGKHYVPPVPKKSRPLVALNNGAVKTACPECGGDGHVDAAIFGEAGWHPCFYCGTSGNVNVPMIKWLQDMAIHERIALFGPAYRMASLLKSSNLIQCDFTEIPF